jgi:hypothetical protein
MAKKSKVRNEHKFRSIIPVGDKLDLVELNPLAELLHAKVQGYLDELDRMFADAQESDPGITESQMFMLWAMRRIAFLETMAESNPK